VIVRDGKARRAEREVGEESDEEEEDGVRRRLPSYADAQMWQ